MQRELTGAQARTSLASLLLTHPVPLHVLHSLPAALLVTKLAQVTEDDGKSIMAVQALVTDFVRAQLWECNAS